jgi:uncharacterized membrane protein YdjX (TVP38/TMEM64 family)
MEKTKKIKLFLGLSYFVFISFFFYFLFSKYSLQEITSYDFIKNNRDYFFELRQSNLFLLVTLFVLLSIFWILVAGFASPLALCAGFVFGKWLGFLILIFSMAVGATILYIFANYFLKDLIKEKFLNKFKNLEVKFKESEFNYLLIYRFIGGIPFALANILPCIFNVKISNFFWSTLIGLIPQVFLITSIGSGLEKIIDQNMQTPSIMSIITSKDIFIPLIVFFVLVLITIYIRRFFYQK